MAKPEAFKNDKLERLAAQKPLTKYGREARHKMAVLFTDVVGSTRYFEAQGDQKGRAMLKRHQEVATGAIDAHEGIVVKTIGDSVLAYFLDPAAAMRAAVTILQNLQQSNRRLKRRERIQLRIGMHFGEGIIEDNDIFGNVVNLAAKIVTLAEPDQICISGTLKNRIADLEGLTFKHVVRTGSPPPLEDVDVYRVRFKEDLIFESRLATMLNWRVVPGTSAAPLKKALETAISDSVSGGEKIPIRESLWIDDHTLCVVMKRSDEALWLARKVLGQLVAKDKPAGKETVSLPLQCHIDHGPYFRSGKLFHADQEINWFSQEAGCIYMSATAYETLEGRSRIATTPPYVPGAPVRAYKLLLTPEAEDALQEASMSSHSALIGGGQAPCYYCGNRDHGPSDCGSKLAKEVPWALAQIGYQRMDDIRTLFSSPIAHQTKGEHTSSNQDDPAGDVPRLVREAFWELNYLFQLRLFRKVWDSPERDWDRLLAGPAALQKGGPVWLGQDCLRVSNHEQAEILLRKALAESDNDYKVYCAWAFLAVERNDLLLARRYFNASLDRAATNPQKIMLLYFLLRVHLLDGPEIEVHKKLRDIRKLSGNELHCRYHSLKQAIRRPSSEAWVVKELLSMIEAARWVYGAVLIDPDWGRIRKALAEGLQPILQQAREEAEHLLPDAEKALDESRIFFDGNDKLIHSLQSSLEKGHQLIASEGYFGYLDAYHVVNGMIQRARKLIVEKRREIKEALFDLRKTAEKQYEQLAKYQHLGKSRKVRQEVVAALDRIGDTRKQIDHQPELTYNALFEMVAELSRTMERASARMAGLERAYQLRRFSAMFLQKSILWQLINFLVGMTLFPILAHYAGLLFPGISISNRDLWLYQKGFLLLGGVSGVLWALYKTLQKLYPDK